MMRKLSLLILILLFSCEDDGISPNYGCMNETAFNYDENANVDDGSCDLGSPDYLQYIQPIFDANCTSCHGAKNPEGGLNLLSHASLMSGGNSGEVIILEDASNSKLWQLISQYSMPPGNNNLTASEINLIEDWIIGGALP